VRFLVDSRAIYSVLPEEDWRALRLKPEREIEFTLADGTPITRGVSEWRFEIRDESATSPVVLAEKDDGALLGAVTLATLGFMLNPLTREILPMRMPLFRLRRFRYPEPLIDRSSLQELHGERGLLPLRRVH